MLGAGSLRVVQDRHATKWQPKFLALLSNIVKSLIMKRSQMKQQQRIRAAFTFAPGIFPMRIRQKCLALKRRKQWVWTWDQMPIRRHAEIQSHLWALSREIRRLRREEQWLFQRIAGHFGIGRNDAHFLSFVVKRDDLRLGVRRPTATRIIDLYNRGISISRTAILTGEATARIQRVLSQNRVPMRRPGSPGGKRQESETMVQRAKKIVEMYDRDRGGRPSLSFAAIGKHFGLCGERARQIYSASGGRGRTTRRRRVVAPASSARL